MIHAVSSNTYMRFTEDNAYPEIELVFINRDTGYAMTDGTICKEPSEPIIYRMTTDAESLLGIIAALQKTLDDAPRLITKGIKAMIERAEAEANKGVGE